MPKKGLLISQRIKSVVCCRSILNTKSGSSLLELVVVIILIGIVFSFSAQVFKVTDHMFVRRELDRVYSALLYTQRKALLENKPCALTIDPVKGRFAADREYTLSRGVMFGAPAGVFGPPSNPVASINDPVTFPGRVLTCYPDGTISAGALYLTDSQKSCGYALSCDASKVNHIRRYCYDGQWRLM